MITKTYANQMLDSLITGDTTIALSTTKPLLDPMDPSGLINVTEPIAASYARVTFLATDWQPAANRIKKSNIDATFPIPTEDWGTVGWVIVYSGTEAIFFGELDRLVTITAGEDQLNIPAQTISVYLPE